MKAGNSHVLWLSKLVKLADALCVFYWVENPGSSWFWCQRCWRRLGVRSAGRYWAVDFCRFGAPWRKRTKFYTNLSILEEPITCICPGNHLVLRGSGPNNQSWTHIAEPYPFGLCSLLSAACCKEVGYSSDRRLDDLQRFAFRESDLSMRRGDFAFVRSISGAPAPVAQKRRRRRKYDPREADRNHPFAHFHRWAFLWICLFCLCRLAWARGRRMTSGPALPSSRVTVVTQARHNDAIDKSALWLQSGGYKGCLRDLVLAPEVLGGLVRHFGKSLHHDDQPHYRYVYTVTGFIRAHPPLDEDLTLSCDLAHIWTRLEPAVHRERMPEPLCLGSLSFGLLRGWFLFNAMCLFCFYGRLRQLLRSSAQCVVLWCCLVTRLAWAQRLDGCLLPLQSRG
jgi:hypothetical protein